MLDKGEPAYSLLKLIDGCTQCRQIFHGLACTSTDSEGNELLARIEQKLEQFRIELRNEIRHFAAIEQFDGYRFEPLSGEPGNMALSKLLDYYEQALSYEVPALTRLTLTRQCFDLQWIYRDLRRVQKK